MKLRKVWILALIAGTVVVMLIAKETYYWLTDGFSLANIGYEDPKEPQWELRALSQYETDEVEKALKQKFYYLDKGHQAYVFVSDDGQYVLKFLKFQKYRHHWLVDMLPWPSVMQEKLFEKKVYKEKKRLALFNAWKIAFNELSEQTGVLLVQLNRIPSSNKKMRLYNKSGWPYEIDLGRYVFMLQRKVALLEPTLNQQMAQGQVSQAKELIDLLLMLYLNEYNQGISEKDRYIVRNTGVSGGRPIQIDTGRLRKNPRVKQYPANIQELVWKTALLQEWLGEYHPELALHLHQRLYDLQSDL